MFYVPLGLGSYLKHWGVDKNSITELNWDQSSEYDDIELFVCHHCIFLEEALTEIVLWSSWAY